MRDSAPSVFTRLIKKLRGFALIRSFRHYRSMMREGGVLHAIPARIIGDASADPTEFFDHYDAFAYWAARKINARGSRQRILDIGGVKMMNAILSSHHDVTSLVLADCHDQISAVHYVLHDASDPLPFPDASFDVFTSMASLQLVGLGRYGDRLNPNCLPDLVKELGRVMRRDSVLLVSMCLGRNLLNFNNSWFFDIETIKRIFAGWELVDLLVDNFSSPKATFLNAPERFESDASVDRTPVGDYRVVFLQFQRNSA